VGLHYEPGIRRTPGGVLYGCQRRIEGVEQSYKHLEDGRRASGGRLLVHGELFPPRGQEVRNVTNLLRNRFISPTEEQEA
jgi:hypothetical protein